MIQIQTNVPMPDAPPASAGKAAVQKYPWADMQVSNSFYIAGKKEGKAKRYLSTLISKAGKKYGKKFILGEVPTGFNVFCTATGIGTPEAKQWDFTTKEVIPGPFVPPPVEPTEPVADPVEPEPAVDGNAPAE